MRWSKVKPVLEASLIVIPAVVKTIDAIRDSDKRDS